MTAVVAIASSLVVIVLRFHVRACFSEAQNVVHEGITDLVGGLSGSLKMYILSLFKPTFSAASRALAMHSGLVSSNLASESSS